MTIQLTLVHPYYNTDQNHKGSVTLSAALPEKLTRTCILKELVKHNIISAQYSQASLVTCNPRNYYFDLLLSKDIEIYYEEDQLEYDQDHKKKKLIQLPFSLEIAKFEPEYLIDCQNDSFSLSHFNVLQKIGEGTYSQIFLVQRKYDRQLFCMKRINKAECKDKGSLDMINNEFEILEYTSKYKIKMYYQFEDLVHIYLIIDYCPFGDLYNLIKMNKKPDEILKLNLTEKYNIWIQIALGIACLHDKGLIYRDLKPQNILIDQYERIRICDFGFACRISPHQKLNKLCGSYEYFAPEMLTKEGYDKSIDLYCLGLLFYELLTGTNPFEGITPKTVMEIKNKPINFEKKQISNTVKDLLKKLLKEKPEERIGYQSTTELFKHDFFKQNGDLVRKILKGQTHLKNIRYTMPPQLDQRNQTNEKETFIFPKGTSYNYMMPAFDVTQNVGPKFESE